MSGRLGTRGATAAPTMGRHQVQTAAVVPAFCVDNGFGVSIRLWEFVVAHLGTEIFQQRPAEAGDDATVLGELRAGLGAVVSAREGHDAHDTRMVDQAVKQARLHGQAEFQHDLFGTGH